MDEELIQLLLVVIPAVVTYLLGHYRGKNKIVKSIQLVLTNLDKAMKVLNEAENLMESIRKALDDDVLTKEEAERIMMELRVLIDELEDIIGDINGGKI